MIRLVHVLLIVEERLREQRADGVRMPEGIPLDDLGTMGEQVATAMEAVLAGSTSGSKPRG
jgi:hypothetical protein